MSNFNSADSSSNDSNKLIPGLYKLVSGLNKVNETSNVPSKDLLLQLDSNDTNELTTKLKERLTKSLGPLIEKELEKHNQALVSNTNPGAIVNSISESVLESTSYKEVYSTISDSLREATFSVIEEMELHSREGSLNNYLPVDTQTSESISLNLQYAYMPYISSNYLKELVIKFDPSNSADVRREALQAIIQFSPSEILSCPDWPTLHVLVTRSLADLDQFISNNSFGILLRLFSTSNLTAIKEAYLILVEHLIESSSNATLCVKQGVDVCKPDIGGVMQRFHLLTVFIHRLPNYWFRFNNAFMSEIIDKTIDLLMLDIDRESLTSFSKSHSVSPIHILGIIDHKANWFQTLLHSEYSRQFIVNKLEKHPTFLSTIAEYVLIFARQIEPNLSHFATEITDAPYEYYYNEDCLNYLFFIAALKIMQNIIIFECRQLLFPNSFDGEYFRLKNDAVIHFITTLLDNLFSHNNNSVEKEFDPSYIIQDTLMKALKRGRISDALFSNGKIVASLIRSVNRKEGTTDFFREVNSHLYYVYEVLGCITECDMGKKLFINHGTGNTNFIDLFTQTKALLETIPTSPLPNTITTVLFPIVNLLSTPEGSILEATYTITQFLSSLLETLTFSQNSNNIDELIDMLCNLITTPKGVLCLKQHNLLDECVEFLFLKTDVNLHSYKKGSARYGYLLSQICNFPCSIITLERTGIIEYLTDVLVKLLKRTNEHLLYQQASLIAPLTRDVHKAIYNLATVFVNYATLTEIIGSQSITAIQEPSSIVPPIMQLILDYVLVSPSEQINNVSNFEEIHIICLSLLNLILTSLDNFLLLEESVGLTTVLISLQNYTATKNDIQMLDQLWYERNRALLKIGIIGGPSEKLHPANSLYCYEEIERNKFPSYKDFPLPLAYSNFKQRIPWIQDGTKEFPTTQLELQNWFSKHLSSGQNKAILKSTQSLLQHTMSQTSDSTFPKNLTTYDSNIKGKLLASEQTATKLIIQYGVNHGLLRDKESNEKQLISLILNTKAFLVSQQINIDKNITELKSLQSDTYCYDWFVSLIFILMQGDAQLSYTLLTSFSTQICSGYIWVNRLHKSKLLAQNQAIGCHCAMTNLMQWLEFIVKSELPNIYSAFQISGLCLSTVCSIWVRQCFLNYLDFEEICNYFLTVLIMGVKYQMYFIVSILKHLEQDILSSTQENNLMHSLLENPIRGFATSAWIEYMRELEDRSKGIVKEGFLTLSDK